MVIRRSPDEADDYGISSDTFRTNVARRATWQTAVDSSRCRVHGLIKLRSRGVEARTRFGTPEKHGDQKAPPAQGSGREVLWKSSLVSGQ
jgi:hypothetical protein